MSNPPNKIKQITTVTEANSVTVHDIRQYIDLDAARARATRPDYSPPNNRLEPWPFDMPELGTWIIDSTGGAWVLVEIPLSDFRPGEGDWDHALGLPSTQKYIEWARAGLEPPPLYVVETDKGHLSSLNRRRWLAAREAGRPSLKCWYSRTDPERAPRPLWYLAEYNAAKVHAYTRWLELGRDPIECMRQEDKNAIRAHLLAQAGDLYVRPTPAGGPWIVEDGQGRALAAEKTLDALRHGCDLFVGPGPGPGTGPAEGARPAVHLPGLFRHLFGWGWVRGRAENMNLKIFSGAPSFLPIV